MCLLCQDRPGDSMALLTRGKRFKKKKKNFLEPGCRTGLRPVLSTLLLLTGMPWGRHALLSANQDAMLRRHAPAADPAEGHHALPIHTHGHAPSGMHCWECCGAMPKHAGAMSKHAQTCRCHVQTCRSVRAAICSPGMPTFTAWILCALLYQPCNARAHALLATPCAPPGATMHRPEGPGMRCPCPTKGTLSGHAGWAHHPI